MRRELERIFPNSPPPLVLRPLLTTPEAALGRLCDLLADYWAAALAGHWPRVRSLLQADVLYRARQLTLGGARRLLADLYPTVTWSNGRIRVAKRWNSHIELSGLGLVLAPSAFSWPEVLVVSDEPWQPALVYPARGVATLWEAINPPLDALVGLVGRGRAAVLAALERPATTTDLAHQLGMSAAGVSGHLHRLHDAGLAARHRHGRAVLYVRTQLGERLLRAAASDQPSR